MIVIKSVKCFISAEEAATITNPSFVIQLKDTLQVAWKVLDEFHTFLDRHMMSHSSHVTHARYMKLPWLWLDHVHTFSLHDPTTRNDEILKRKWRQSIQHTFDLEPSLDQTVLCKRLKQFLL